MPMTFCWTAPDGQKMCVEIPVLIQKFPFGPDPDPTIILRGPFPEPWIQGQGITPELATTLTKMATLMGVAQRLGGELPAMTENMLMEHTGRMKLPAGAYVEIGGRKSSK